MHSNNNTLKVAFLFIHLHRGGMQKVVSNLSLVLPDNIVQYIVYFGTENPGFTYNGVMCDLKVAGSEATGIIAKLINFYKRRLLLRQFFANNNIDICISHGEAANVMNMLVRSPRKILVIHSYIRNSLSGLYGGLYKILVKVLYRFAPEIVAVSKDLAGDTAVFCGIKNDKIKVIYNLFELGRIREQAKLSPDTACCQRVLSKPYVLTVGSLVTLKGHDHLLRAFAIARKCLPDLQLVIAGSGAELESLRSIARNLRIGEAVHFLGFVPNPYPLMANAKAFVLASHLEGLPTVLIEAMICGAPVIATDCPTGPREILDGGKYGVLVDNITPANEAIVEAEIAQWIVTLITTGKGAYYRRKSAERCLDFSADKILPQWLELLQPHDTGLVCQQP